MKQTRCENHRWTRLSFCAVHLSLIALAISMIGCSQSAPAVSPSRQPAAEQEAAAPATPEVVFSPPIIPGKQQKSNWCWAACINVILRSAGLDSTQEQVVRQAHGDTANVSLTVPQIEHVFNNSVLSTTYMSGKPTRGQIRSFFASGAPGTRRLVMERRRGANWDWSEEWHAVLVWGYEIWPDGHLYVYLYDPEYDQAGRIDFGDDERWQRTFFVKVNPENGIGHEQQHVAGGGGPDVIPDGSSPRADRAGQTH